MIIILLSDMAAFSLREASGLGANLIGRLGAGLVC